MFTISKFNIHTFKVYLAQEMFSTELVTDQVEPIALWTEYLTSGKLIRYACFSNFINPVHVFVH